MYGKCMYLIQQKEVWDFLKSDRKGFFVCGAVHGMLIKDEKFAAVQLVLEYTDDVSFRMFVCSAFSYD